MGRTSLKLNKYFFMSIIHTLFTFIIYTIVKGENNEEKDAINTYSNASVCNA